MKRAIYDCGPVNGLRVYAEGNPVPILHIDPCNVSALKKIGRDAYGADKLRLVFDGEEYDVPARRLSEDIASLID
jgi:hypothetical protein